MPKKKSIEKDTSVVMHQKDKAPKKEFPKDGLVKLQEVLEFVSMSKSTWYGLIEENIAPKQLKIKNMSRWDAKEIRKWKKNLRINNDH